MKIYGIFIVLAPPSEPATILTSASDLAHIGRFARTDHLRVLELYTPILVGRIPQGQSESVQENDYTFHVYNRGGAEQLAGQ